MVIATKLFFGDGNGDGRITTKLSRKAIFHQVEKSLKRLGTDYIDILYIHRWDYDTPIEETMAALNDLVHSGKVLYLGGHQLCMLGNSKRRNTLQKKMVGPNLQSCKTITIYFTEKMNVK